MQLHKIHGEHYYGSDLNRFIDEKCSREQTCINIDCYLLKIAKKRLRFIESKHTTEFAPRSQLTALKILQEIIRDSGNKQWKVEFYIVYGNYPFAEATQIEDLFENVKAVLNQGQLVQWLNFEKELEDFI
jgi:hypothetical protein